MAEGTMHGRERFIGRIASRLGRARPLSTTPEHPARGVPPHYAAIELSEQEKLELFTRNWTALTGRVKLVPRERAEQEIVSYIGELAAEFGISRIARWDEERLNQLGLDEGLRAKGLQVVPWREDGAATGASGETAADGPEAGEDGAKDGAEGGSSPSDPFHTGNWAKRHPLLRAVERCGMGIVWPDAVIANSGTLALFADPGKGRSVSLLTDVLVAIFDQAQLVVRMGEVFAAMKERYGSAMNIPSSVNLITGPSRSADIENDLTVGVHGPGKVVAIIITP
jgi:L-lactate utilization protein LutC